MSNKKIVRASIREGLIWAGGMFVGMLVLYPILFNESIALPKLLLSIPIWIVLGTIFAYLIIWLADNNQEKPRSAKDS